MDFLESLNKYLSKEDIIELNESLKSSNVHGLLLNENKMYKKTFLSYFPLLKPHPYIENGFIIDKNDKIDYNKHIFHELGLYYLQEPSAMLVASLLGKSDDCLKVLDMCCAPGGKLIQFAINNINSTIIGNDISFNRLQAVIENVERMGLDNVVVSNNDFLKIYNQYINYFDVIILDAPCSGSGMFRKDEKMINDWSYNKVLKYAKKQKELINIAYKMLAKGGRLIYSTCSYSYEENEEVISNLLNTFSDIHQVELEIGKHFYVDNKTKLGFHIFPHLFNGEGHYICLLKKEGNTIKKCFKQISTFKKDDIEYYLNNNIKTANLNIIRYGVKYKKVFKNNDYLFFYHYSHTFNLNNLNNSEFPLVIINEEQARAYAQGFNVQYETRQFKNEQYVLLIYKNIALSFAKINSNYLKNIFPKYLKTKKYIF